MAKFDIRHTAKLANLGLSSEEEEKISRELEEILSYVNKLNEVDPDLIGVEPTSHITGLENVTRPDETSPSLTQTEVLQNSKNTHNGMFKVPAILEDL
ncbi:Asp-tRNA(Asn)/Glu-tRNA(Gln) amidotransferase subunit GatC [Candidatus Microgenomates bacterium]|nr:Asp-tRNA(Asn)/Glu-tRNA(Gln) amidotransferase subunit GatC [Candidatus Microgenomates bacterium]